MQGLRREVRSRHRHTKPSASRPESSTHATLASPDNGSGSYHSNFQLDSCQQGTARGQMVRPDTGSDSRRQQQQQGFAAGFRAESHHQHQSGRFAKQDLIPEAAKGKKMQRRASRQDPSIQVDTCRIDTCVCKLRVRMHDAIQQSH